MEFTIDYGITLPTMPYFNKAILLTAYRKAKVDLYYSTNPPLLEMMDYEEKLDENLEALLEKLNSKDTKWVEDKEFLGVWSVSPTQYYSSSSKDGDASNVVVATDNGNNLTPKAGIKPSAEFRIMAKCSIDFHIVSTLWMMMVGEEFEKKLSKNAYGSRLRRKKDGEFNLEALGSFEPYLHPFRKWQSDAIEVMRGALKEDKQICTLTADVSSFYHKIDVEFLNEEKFLNIVNKTEPKKILAKYGYTKIHEIFTKALTAWAASTPLQRGLPVGLPASAVVANLALIELDTYIEQKVAPLHYGRYVDDIILVIENNAELSSIQDVWKWLFAADTRRLFKVVDGTAQFKPSYLSKTDIKFENEKNKLFILSGNQGLGLINTISDQIRERASEWRALPILPEDAEAAAKGVLEAISTQGKRVDKLREADSLVFQRSSFAITLKNFEAYERDLPANAWQKQRHVFLETVLSHLFQPKHFFDLHQYLPRIVRLATASEDFEHIDKLFTALVKLIRSIDRKETVICIKGVNSNDDVENKISEETQIEILDQFRLEMCSNFITQFAAAFPVDLPNRKVAKWEKLNVNKLFEDDWISGETFFGLIDKARDDIWNLDAEKAQKIAIRLFSYDLAYTPLRFLAYPKQLVKQQFIPKRSELETLKIELNDAPMMREPLHELAELLSFEKKSLPSGFVFATRPFNAHDLFLIDQKNILGPPNENKAEDDISDLIGLDRFNQIMAYYRGFQWVKRRPYLDAKGLLFVSSDNNNKSNPKVAVTSWEVSNDEFVAAARNRHKLTLKRYNRLNRLVNNVIAEYKKPDYVVLPELSIPPSWFIRIAGKFKKQGISLIAGVEYLHGVKQGEVYNQVWMSLVHEALGFPSMLIYRQDKQVPAIGEETELNRINNLALVPENSWKKPPVVFHKGWCFSALICSELTNVHHRAHLSGKVDALFVLEWNQDINSFNALVEAAALDVHAFVVQCNNRIYGDSRIRAPYKNDWERDVLRVKGGVSDYYVVGEIDVKGLREFQSYHRPPAGGKFKPKPEGYKQAARRK